MSNNQNVFQSILDSFIFNKILISNKTLNKFINERICCEDFAKISNINIKTEDNLLSVIITTQEEKINSISVSIEEFYYKDKKGVIVYKIKNCNLNYDLIQYSIFLLLTIGLLKNHIHDNPPYDCLDVKIEGNIVTVDFSKLCDNDYLPSLYKIKNPKIIDKGIIVETTLNINGPFYIILIILYMCGLNFDFPAFLYIAGFIIICHSLFAIGYDSCPYSKIVQYFLRIVSILSGLLIIWATYTGLLP